MLHMLAEQEKNRVEHNVPLHPLVGGAINEVLANGIRRDAHGAAHTRNISSLRSLLMLASWLNACPPTDIDDKPLIRQMICVNKNSPL